MLSYHVSWYPPLYGHLSWRIPTLHPLWSKYLCCLVWVSDTWNKSIIEDSENNGHFSFYHRLWGYSHLVVLFSLISATSTTGFPNPIIGFMFYGRKCVKPFAELPCLACMPSSWSIHNHFAIERDYIIGLSVAIYPTAQLNFFVRGV